MKNIFTLLILLASIGTLSAQLHKGVVLLGGNVGFNNYSEEGDGYTVINVSPQAGFFLSDRFALGASLNTVLQISEGSNFSSFGLTPFARYYFNGSGTARFFGQAHVGFQSTKIEGFDANGALLFGLGVGADFFLNDRVAIEGLLGYQRVENTGETAGGYNNIGLSFGVAAFIGGGGDEE